MSVCEGEKVVNNWIDVRKLRQGFISLVRANEQIFQSVDMPFSSDQAVWDEYFATSGVSDFLELHEILMNAEKFAREAIRRLKNGIQESREA